MVKRKFYTHLYLVYISPSFSIFFYYYFKKISTTASEKKRKKSPLRGFSLRRYVVTRYAVTRFTNNQAMITAICCVVRLCLTRFKNKVSYVVHIVDIYLLSRSFTLHANVNILKFTFHLHTIQCTICC